MTTSRYKGFLIMARPYQIAKTGLWTVDLEIRRNGRRQPYSLGERYKTEREADTSCTNLARRIVDGEVPGSSVDHLRDSARPAKGGSLVPAGNRAAIGATLLKIGSATLVLILLLTGLSDWVGGTERMHSGRVLVAVGGLAAAVVALLRHAGKA